jgi:hypothetical protein
VDGGDHFQRGEFRVAAVNVIAADDYVFEPVVAPLVGDVAGEFVVAGGAGDVGLGGENFVLAAFALGRGDGFKFFFEGGPRRRG